MLSVHLFATVVPPIAAVAYVEPTCVGCITEPIVY